MAPLVPGERPKPCVILSSPDHEAQTGRQWVIGTRMSSTLKSAYSRVRVGVGLHARDVVCSHLMEVESALLRTELPNGVPQALTLQERQQVFDAVMEMLGL